MFRTRLKTKRKWVRINNKDNPSGRNGNSGVSFCNSIFLFGGYDGKTRLNELHEYNVALKTWTLHKTKGKIPVPREGHSATVYGHSMFVCCGYDGNYCNDVYECNLLTLKWKRIVAKGIRPKPRYYHAAVQLEHRLIIHGGGYDVHSNNDNFLNDLLEFDCRTYTWRYLQNYGQVPSGRFFHDGVLDFSKQFFYIFGGYNTKPLDDFFRYHIGNNVWERIIPTGDVPTARSAFGLVNYQNCMYLFGGLDLNYALNDFYEYNFTTNVFKKIENIGDVPLSRYNVTMVAHYDTLFLIGGYDDGKRIDQFHQHDLVDLFQDELFQSLQMCELCDIKIVSS